MEDLLGKPYLKDTFTSYLKRVLHSYKYWTGKDLTEVPFGSNNISDKIFNASFVLASHDNSTDPKFKYGNKKALDLWELSWNEFINMPSKKTAEDIFQNERKRLLEEVYKNGYSTNYKGIRVSSTGKRFEILDAILWNVLDKNNKLIGQAVKFDRWKFIEEKTHE